MRNLIFAVALAGFSVPATGSELPISAAYGTPIACAIYAEDGLLADVIEGASNQFTNEQISDEPGYLVVAPTEIAWLEGGCTPASADGLTMNCESTDMTWEVRASITVVNDGENIIYSDEMTRPVTFVNTAGETVLADADDPWSPPDPPVTLHKCPATTEPATM